MDTDCQVSPTDDQLATAPLEETTQKNEETEEINNVTIEETKPIDVVPSNDSKPLSIGKKWEKNVLQSQQSKETTKRIEIFDTGKIRNKWQSMENINESVSEASEDWKDIEASILNNTSKPAVLEKWKDLEKGNKTDSEVSKPVRTVGKIDLNKVRLFNASSEEEGKEVTPSSPSGAKVGNVFQFLQQKQKQVREEQEKEHHDTYSMKLAKYKDLPSVPPLPQESSPEIQMTDSKKSKKELKEEKKKQKEKEKKEKKEKKLRNRDVDLPTYNLKRSVSTNQITSQSTTVSRSKSVDSAASLAHHSDYTVYSLVDYKTTDPRVLSLSKGDVVVILDDKFNPQWVEVQFEENVGVFPKHYLHIPEKAVVVQPLKIVAVKDINEPTERKSSTSSQNSKKEETANHEEEDSSEILKENNVIRGISLEKAIQRLTDETVHDPSFLSTFLLTYTSILTASELAKHLVGRFQATLYTDESKKLSIRLRVLDFIKLWVKKEYSKLEEEKVLTVLLEFMEQTVAKDAPSMAKEIIEIMKTKPSSTKTLKENKKTPVPHIPKNLKAELTFNDIHPEEVARQITLLEHSLLSKIRSDECVKQRWSKGERNEAPNIHAMAERFNQVSQWVATDIVSVEDTKLRAVSLSKFIFIAQKCRELNNYNAVMEILSALNGSSVHRLRQTWELLPPKSLEVFENLNRLMDGEGNFALYRDALKKSQGAAVPYLGLVLTDLVFIDDGNPDYLADTKLVNVAKLNLLSNVIRDLLQFGDTNYCLEKVEFIQDFLIKRPYIDNQQELYDLSCKREEKTRKSRKVRPGSEVK